MTAQERRLLALSTGGVALLALAGCGVVTRPRVALPVLLVLAGLTLLRWCIVGWLYESKPRVRRMAWRRPGIGPAEVRRLGELMHTSSNQATGICGAGIERYAGQSEARSVEPAGAASTGRRPSFADPDEGRGTNGAGLSSLHEYAGNPGRPCLLDLRNASACGARGGEGNEREIDGRAAGQLQGLRRIEYDRGGWLAVPVGRLHDPAAR